MKFDFAVGDILLAGSGGSAQVHLVLSAENGATPLTAVGLPSAQGQSEAGLDLPVSLPGAVTPSSLFFSAARLGGLSEGQPLSRLGQVAHERLEPLLRALALRATQVYFDGIKAPRLNAPFQPGQSAVPVSGRVYDGAEMRALTDTALDFWLTTGRFNEAFEKRFAEFLGIKHVLTTNSGSSANLLAVTALTSPKLGDRRLQPGDEVLTVAAGFPTTVNPIIQNGLVPVFADVHIPTYNVDPAALEAAVGPRTRAVILAHTLGNPFDLGAVMRLAKKHNLWVIEDCCDALGASYTLNGETHRVGTFGHIAAYSFYPAHHITMGEGGAVATNDSKLKKIIESFRDWGRDCWCAPGHDNSCGCRFEWKLGELPQGYDHKYVYSHVGYNLKITDMQAAVALAQMDKLEGFISTRQTNFDLLTSGLADLADRLILPEPTPDATPSWFGFPITLRPECPVDRETLMVRLNEARIGTRLLFGGNLTRQPYMLGRQFRKCGELPNTDIIMNRTFWIGVYPGLKPEMIRYMIDSIRKFVSGCR